MLSVVLKKKHLKIKTLKHDTFSKSVNYSIKSWVNGVLKEI